MQKLIETQFFCYPKKQDLCILYADKKQLKSRLFKALSIQISPKEGFLLRLRKSIFGHNLSAFKKSDVLKLNIPENSNLKIGYKNKDKIIFFEFDENDKPTKVLRNNSSDVFEESNFIGYSLIEKYSKKEYFIKRDSIKQALEKRWEEIIKSEILHGDFTHFNILFSSENTIHFIDAKKVKNAILFDHFYFYSYYMQCLERCETISNKDVAEIKIDLQNIIYKTLNLDNIKEVLSILKIEDAMGVIPSERENKFQEFSNFLTKNEK